MTTRDIRTSTAITTCDVCGRTLLRGEHAQVYLNGAVRHSVCELCVPRAINEGWLREGTVPSYAGGDGTADRRRSLLGRLRRRREHKPPPRRAPAPAPEPEFEPMLEYDEEPPPPRESPFKRARDRARERAAERGQEQAARKRERETVPEPRHVRAVPASAEQKAAAAIEVFNHSEHQRTVAGVARSLGPPAVAIRPAQGHPSTVSVTVSWELCWYRYEIDLGDDVPGVRVDAQGYELDELESAEKRANAVCDENGSLSLRSTNI